MRRSSGYVQVLVDEARRRNPSLQLDLADSQQARCFAPECAGRPFFGEKALREHAEAVHTFDEAQDKPQIQRVVRATGFVVARPKMEARRSPKFTG